jgi:protein-S-isoprenylcysteine O-methyltransferase Ste14
VITIKRSNWIYYGTYIFIVYCLLLFSIKESQPYLPLLFVAILTIVLLLPVGPILLKNRHQTYQSPRYIDVISVLFCIFVILKILYNIFFKDPIKTQHYLFINAAIYTFISTALLLWNQSVKYMNSQFADGIYKPEKLLVNGPFGLVRNPIYLSYILAFLVSLLLYPFAFYGKYIFASLTIEVPLLIMGYMLINYRIKEEEKVLLTFDEYSLYKVNTPMLFPTYGSFIYFMKQPFNSKNE